MQAVLGSYSLAQTEMCDLNPSESSNGKHLVQLSVLATIRSTQQSFPFAKRWGAVRTCSSRGIWAVRMVESFLVRSVPETDADLAALPGGNWFPLH